MSTAQILSTTLIIGIIGFIILKNWTKISQITQKIQKKETQKKEQIELNQQEIKQYTQQKIEELTTEKNRIQTEIQEKTAYLNKRLKTINTELYLLTKETK